MKIALYISSMKDGGAERTMGNIANYMCSQGHEVIMVNAYRFDREYPLDERIKRVICEPGDDELNGGRIGNFRTRFLKLRNIWKQESPDVIFSYLGKTNIMTVLTTRGLNIPTGVGVVATPTEEYYTKGLRFTAKTVFRFADVIVLQTEASKSFFPNAILKKSVILKNPMTPEFDIERYAGERDKTIISVGRIDENKNHELIIDAFADIADKYPDYKVIIYGDGDLRPYLIEKVDKMGLSGRILLPGRIDNVAETIKKAGVFILSSNAEGSPNALIEAMMLGIPVISTDCPCGGPAELIEHEKNGLLIPVGNKDKMQEALQKILDNLQFSNDIGENAAKTRDIYSPKKVMKDWEMLFESMKNKG